MLGYWSFGKIVIDCGRDRLLRRRARRVRIEREMAELTQYLDKIRESGYVRRIYGDEVG